LGRPADEELELRRLQSELGLADNEKMVARTIRQKQQQQQRLLEKSEGRPYCFSHSKNLLFHLLPVLQRKIAFEIV
jgi:hypothetical protein